jgi:hypothetical protein
MKYIIVENIDGEYILAEQKEVVDKNGKSVVIYKEVYYFHRLEDALKEIA